MNNLIIFILIFILVIQGCYYKSPADKAIDFVLKQEGKFSDYKKDPGGATNYGISLRLLKSLGVDIDMDGDTDVDDILALNEKLAADIYKNEWWEKYHYDQIKDPEIARMILSLSVNLGPGNAHRIIQRALNRFIQNKNKNKLLEDGVLGKKTIEYINEIISKNVEDKRFISYFKEYVKIHSELYYKNIVQKNPDLQMFLKGWMKRVQEITK